MDWLFDLIFGVSEQEKRNREIKRYTDAEKAGNKAMTAEMKRLKKNKQGPWYVEPARQRTPFTAKPLPDATARNLNAIERGRSGGGRW